MANLNGVYQFNINAPNFLTTRPVRVTYPRVPFRGNDSFTNPFEDRLNKSYLENTARANSNIKNILSEYNIPIKVNAEELNKLQNGHLRDTRVLSAKIYSALPIEMKNEVNVSELQEAAMYHDIGKVLLPNDILNKNGSLSPKEREIVELHSQLGYELLKDSGLSENTLNLIKYHHQTPTKNGYPIAESDFNYGVSEQILRVADEYSALTEDRSYKNAMSKEKALEIIKQDVDDGNISPEVYNSLKVAVSY